MFGIISRHSTFMAESSGYNVFIRIIIFDADHDPRPFLNATYSFLKYSSANELFYHPKYLALNLLFLAISQLKPRTAYQPIP